MAKLFKFPQLEFVMISEIMTSIWANFKARPEGNKTKFLCNTMANLLNELLNTVAQQHQECTQTEDHWAETDIKQLLKDSMEDINLLKQSIGEETEASLPINDVIKCIGFICNQFDERCTVIEQDMNYCVEKFQDIIVFEEGEGAIFGLLMNIQVFNLVCNLALERFE